MIVVSEAIHMKKMIAIGLITLAVAATAVAAYPGFHQTWDNDKLVQHEQMQKAIETHNFDAYTQAVADTRWSGAITEDQFNNIVERYDEHVAIEDAIENNDYDAWLTAVENTPYGDNMKDIIGQEDFADMVAMHNARESGDMETADALREELGLERGMFGIKMGNPEGSHNGMGPRDGRGKGLHDGSGARQGLGLGDGSGLGPHDGSGRAAGRGLGDGSGLGPHDGTGPLCDN